MQLLSDDVRWPWPRALAVLMTIAIVVLTHNKPELLPQCVETVLYRTSDLTREIVIWDNASGPETRDYLQTLTDPRIHVVRHPRNIGQSAYAPAFRMTQSDYLVTLDDDVVDAPPEWDRTLLSAFRAIHGIGYLALNLVHDPNDPTSRAMYGKNAALYSYEEINGIRLKIGPVGGWCAMTSRTIHDEVGGFPQDKRRVFFLEDAAYIEQIERRGYFKAILADAAVHHKGGRHYASYYPPEKTSFWEDYLRFERRKNAVKRALLRVPFVDAVNARLRLFEPPGR